MAEGPRYMHWLWWPLVARMKEGLEITIMLSTTQQLHFLVASDVSVK